MTFYLSRRSASMYTYRQLWTLPAESCCPAESFLQQDSLEEAPTFVGASSSGVQFQCTRIGDFGSFR
jgi:hypothetical protein